MKKTIKKIWMAVWKTALGGALILSLAGCSMNAGSDISKETAASEKTSAASESSGAAQSSETADSSSSSEGSGSGESSGSGEGSGSSEGSDGSAVSTDLSAELSQYYTDRDISGDYDESEAVQITLSGTSASVSGSSGQVTVSDGLVTIGSEGVYLLSGDFEGQIVVDAADTEKVQLVLDGVTLYDEDSAAIYIKSADKTFLTLAAGTQNTVKTGSSFTFADGEDEPDAAIFSKDDLTINGSGSLDVSTGYADGIVSKDDLKICGGTITVAAQDDAVRGKDSVRVYAGVLDLKTNTGHGLKATNEEEEGKGYIRVDGGTITIQSAADGLHACSDITIDGGTLTISASDDGMHSDANLIINGGTIDVTDSYEGLEGYTITISGGDIHVSSDDDGLNAAGGSDTGGQGFFDSFNTASSSEIFIQINGGTLVVEASGDGIDSNGNLYMNGGTVYVNGPATGGNGSLDYGENGEAVITGGTIVTAGTADMAENFGSSSTQASLMVNTGNCSAGSTVTLQDSEGNTLLEMTPTCSYSCVIFSCPQMQVGQTYTVLVNGAEVQSVTLSSTITGSGNGMGGMGPGGNGGSAGPGGNGGSAGPGGNGGGPGGGGFGGR